MSVIPTEEEKQEKQFTLDDQFRKSVEKEFQDAIRAFNTATDENEYAAAAKLLDASRSILFLELGLSLEEVVQLVDAA